MGIEEVNLSGTETHKKRKNGNGTFKRRRVLKNIRNYLLDNQSYYTLSGEDLPPPDNVKKYIKFLVREGFQIHTDNVKPILIYIRYRFFNDYVVYGRSRRKNIHVP